MPSSVENRKIAGAVAGSPFLFTPDILNARWPSAVLKTSPVGVPAEPSGSPGAGIETTSAKGEPAVL